MDDLFADRHRDVSIQPNDIDLEARWAAVETLAGDLDAPRAAQIAQYAYGQFTELDDEWLRRPFKDAEPSFAMRNNNAEMSMLSGCVLDQAIHHGTQEIAILAAYLCQLARDLAWPEPFEGFSAAAARRLRALSVELRTPQVPPTIAKQLGPWQKTLQTKLKTHKDAGGYISGAILEDVVTHLASETTKAFGAVADQLAAVTAWAEERVAIAEEETDLLYWLLSGWSSSADAPWASLPPTTVALLGPRELVEQIAILPEPPQAVALLTQLLRMAGPDSAGELKVTEPLVPQEIADFMGDVNGATPIAAAVNSLHQALALRAWEAASGDDE